MTARAAAAEENRRRILFAAFQLFLERYYDEVRLEDVAARAGVSQATVLRAFGSKEGVTRGVSDRVAQAFEALDAQSEPDLASAMDVLIANYEATGDAFVRLLALEGRIAEVQHALDTGRRYHRQWLGKVFARELEAVGAERREALFQQLYVLTDLMVWKLLRRDLGASAEDTARRVLELVAATLTSFGVAGVAEPSGHR